MAVRLHKFEPRAVRYVLRPADRKIMRFVSDERSDETNIESTILLNMSETGIAFLVSPDTQLRVRERVKVEIPVPGGEQLAWWGRVVRMEEYAPRSWSFGRDPFKEQSQMLVAVRFDDLPFEHASTIRQGIEAAFLKVIREQSENPIQYYKAVANHNWVKVSIYMILTLMALAVLYVISLPGGNYHPEKGSPWGERFKRLSPYEKR